MNSLLKYTSIFLIAIFYIGCDSNIAQSVLAEADFSIKNAKSLEVKGRFCNVVLEGTNADLLKFSGYIKGNGNADKYEIEYEENNGHVKVWINSPNSMWGNIRAELRFEVPEDVLLIVDNSSGNVDARGLIAEKLTLEASSGNIDAENLKGMVGIKCSSGNITVYGQYGSLVTKASSGNIKIEDVNGNTSVITSSGNIQVYGNDGDVTTECSSGNIRLKDIKGKLYAKATSGNINGKGIFITGESSFKASSGNIDVELLNEEEELSFDLDAGSGNLYAAGSSGDDRLILTKGPIKIYGVTSSGNQRYSTNR